MEYEQDLQGLWTGYTNKTYYETVASILSDKHKRAVEIIQNRDDLCFLDEDFIILRGFDHLTLDLSLNPVDNLTEMANSLCEVLDGFNWKDTVFYLGSSSE